MSCSTVGAMLSTRGVDVVDVLMFFVWLGIPVDRRLSTPLSGLMMCRLTVGSLRGPTMAMGRTLLMNSVILLIGSIAVDNFTCRAVRLVSVLSCLRSMVRRVFCPALVMVRILLSTIALILCRTMCVPDASSRHSDLGAAMRTLGGREVTVCSLCAAALLSCTVTLTLGVVRLDVLYLVVTLLSGVWRPPVILMVSVPSGEMHSIPIC